MGSPEGRNCLLQRRSRGSVTHRFHQFCSCGCSRYGKTFRCQRRDSEFESRQPLQFALTQRAGIYEHVAKRQRHSIATRKTPVRLWACSPTQTTHVVTYGLGGLFHMQDREGSNPSATTTQDSSPGGGTGFTCRPCRVRFSGPVPTLLLRGSRPTAGPEVSKLMIGVRIS